MPAEAESPPWGTVIGHLEAAEALVWLAVHDAMEADPGTVAAARRAAKRIVQVLGELPAVPPPVILRSPTAAGWYWLGQPGEPPAVVEVYQDDADGDFWCVDRRYGDPFRPHDALRGIWVGPIGAPLEVTDG